MTISKLNELEQLYNYADEIDKLCKQISNAENYIKYSKLDNEVPQDYVSDKPIKVIDSIIGFFFKSILTVLYILVFIGFSLLLPPSKYDALTNFIVYPLAFGAVLIIIKSILQSRHEHKEKKYFNSAEYKHKKAEYKEIINQKNTIIRENSHRVNTLLKKINNSDLLPNAYKNTKAIKKIYTYFANRRVDSFKEAYNLYEQELQYEDIRNAQNEQQRKIADMEYLNSLNAVVNNALHDALRDEINSLKNKLD